MSLSPPRTTPRAPISVPLELAVLAGALLFGLLAAPLLVWVVGSRDLGPYAGGGIAAFLTRFYRGIASGTFGNWMIALGPYLMLLIVRALVGIVRGPVTAD
jgi:hypothetical protein